MPKTNVCLLILFDLHLNLFIFRGQSYVIKLSFKPNFLKNKNK